MCISEEAKKDEKIAKLEALVAKLETDMKETIERLNKELEDEKGRHEFQYNSLKLQLESANVKLREMHDFSLRKAAMEAELISYVLAVYTNGCWTSSSRRVVLISCSASIGLPV